MEESLLREILDKVRQQLDLSRELADEEIIEILKKKFQRENRS